MCLFKFDFIFGKFMAHLAIQHKHDGYNNNSKRIVFLKRALSTRIYDELPK